MPTIEQNRLTWIQALRSGELEQGHSCLVKGSGLDKISCCCLGVAGIMVTNIEPEITLSSPTYDDDRMYQAVRHAVALQSRMQVYLIGMNDGMYVGCVNKIPQIYSGRDALEQTTIIRNTNDRRDFKYIARFLEIAWKLTNMNTVNTANPNDT